MELTIKQVERLQYRKERLAEKANKLEFLLSGRGVSLLPLVRTKTGKHSEKRTWALVEDLLAALEKYETYLQYLEDEENDDRPLVEADCHLPEQERAFYRSFLYCAIRLMEDDHPWVWGRKGVFNDILDLAKSAGIYKEKIALHADELYWRNTDFVSCGQFFGCLDYLYEALTEKSITATLSEEDYRAAEELVQAQKKKDEEDWADFLKELDMTDEEYTAVNQEFYAQFGGEFAVEAEEEPETVPGGQKKLWRETFPNEEMLCQQYLVFRELYFQADRRDLTDKLENMLDFYLYEHGESSFLQDDTYFYTYALLNKVLKQVQDLPKGEAPQ